MKLLLTYLIIALTIVDITYGLNLTIRNNEERSLISNLNIDENFKLSKGPIYARGWLKFKKSLKEYTGKNTGFVKNKFFEEQFKGEENLDLSKEDGVRF